MPARSNTFAEIASCTTAIVKPTPWSFASVAA